MNKLYTLLLVSLATLSSTAQIINIPDANFKAKLLSASTSNTVASTETPNISGGVSTFHKIDTNNDGEIQISEAQLIKYLAIDDSNISSIDGIEYFVNLEFFLCGYNPLISLDMSQNLNLRFLWCNDNQLTSLNVTQNSNLVHLICYYNQLTNLNVSQNLNLTHLHCYNNQLTNLDVTQNPNLLSLYCDFNQLASLDVSQNLNLTDLLCSNNQLTNLDLSQNNNLYYFGCSNNQLTNLDLSQNNNLYSFGCSNNEQLTTLNIKNSRNENGLNFSDNPNLEYICADDSQIATVQAQIVQYGYTNCNVNTYCSFVPGGTFYTIQGNTRFDTTNNGCDATDINISNQKFTISSGSVSGSLIANQAGAYSIPVQAGSHTVTPNFENPTYFTFFPATATVTFPATPSPFTQDFCVTANGVHNDVEVIVMLIGVARPGFDAQYKIIYKNKGNQVSNGTLSFSFDDAVMDLVSALPVNTGSATNSLSWTYSNLNPFESRVIDLTFNINSPMETPAVNAGAILNYTAAIVGATDETPNDNTFTLNQTVVNSYDPNDKTCLEGTTITPSMVGQYVHYVIRFENTGTFAAQNVVVTDVIDATKFDLSSLFTQSSSHSFVTRINNGKVEFIFENINLPFDDANNDGYVAFKIKTKSTLVLGDTFSNTANIYFDFNFPIVTNTATTTIAALANQDFDFGSYFSVYPNPAKDILHLENKNEIGVKAINIYNTLGQMVLVVTNPENNAAIDVANLKTGTYFIKVQTDKGTSNTKFIKE